MKVLLLARYGALGASSRVRFLQYLPCFQAQGIQVTVKPLLSDSYLNALYSGGSRWQEVLKGYAARLIILFSAKRFDVVVIEKELFPFMPALFESLLRLAGVSYVVDYDDALFHRYDCHSNLLVRRLLGKKIDSVMRNARVVIVGNKYLAARAQRAGAKRIELIPTVIDTNRYQRQQQKSEIEVPIVGWIGTPQTSRYLMQLVPVFEMINKQLPVRFVAIGANPEEFEGTPVEVWPWSESTEVASIQQFDIGIMPLVDSPWERGKCGYKLIQYMACGIPVVASPVGVNSEIVERGRNGQLADSLEDWKRTLFEMLQSGYERRQQMGVEGRKKVVEWYSMKAQAPRLTAIISEAIH
ncbi:glycosyltransferase family 4 protein [Marinobacterium lutimaris]|uniref:Glycosyltransferase involved in cell wall bisynthesis n=1 Tax=Marinobacterium lutimaris TaxID=568106 RepID=A0A1H6B8N2_9GAMM|nr:glycosyltransferase family 4 protein [Marinobacterium lutimaris]SEG57199.1 Glycosyltransferase involved in cell wall bisynthesis [Marinobacterium lutimaris]